MTKSPPLPVSAWFDLISGGLRFHHTCFLSGSTMPPQRTSTSSSSKRAQPMGAKTKKAIAAAPEDVESDDPFESPDEETTKRRVAAARQKKQGAEDGDDEVQIVRNGRGDEEEEEGEKTIPKELLTRLLHEFFTKDTTRISRDANATVGKYFDVFVREAIARTAVEKQSGFLEVCYERNQTPFHPRPGDNLLRSKLWLSGGASC